MLQLRKGSCLRPPTVFLAVVRVEPRTCQLTFLAMAL